MRVVGDLVLWERPLGKTVGGPHPDLCDELNVATHKSETNFTHSMRTATVRYEKITEATGIKAETKSAPAGRDFWSGQRNQPQRLLLVPERA